MAFMSSKKDDKTDREFVGYSETTPRQVESGSFIGSTMKIKGDFKSDEDVTIEGNVQGNINVSKTLTIGKNGEVTADIDAGTVRIIGSGKGSLHASDKVEILEQVRYYGDIKSEILVVREGAILIGDINKPEKEEKDKEE